MYIGDQGHYDPNDPWWAKKRDEAHGALNAKVNQLRRDDADRRDEYLKHSRLYGNRCMTDLTARRYHTLESGSRITLNICKSLVDTYVAKMSPNLPKATYITEGGDPPLQRRAKLRDKYIEGLMYKLKMEDRRRDAIRDEAVWGDAILRIDVGEEGLYAGRYFPWELLADHAEAMYPDEWPRTLYCRRYYEKDYLKEIFPDKKDEIDGSADHEPEDTTHHTTTSQVLVTEGIRLPTTKGAKNGRHVMATDNTTLRDRTYRRDSFPFLKRSYTPPTMGFWGTGIISEVVGIQVEINIILKDIQQRFHVASKPMILIHRGARIIKQHLNNKVANLIEWEGVEAPQIISFQTTHPEIFQHLETLIERAYNITGISELSAQAKKAPGLNSGVAQRTYHDIESERAAEHIKADERWHLECAERLIELAETLNEEGKPIDAEVEVKKRSHTFLQVIEYKDIEFQEGEHFRLKAFPMSALPRQPAAKVETVQEWVAAGWITPELSKILVDMPDLEAANDMDPGVAAYAMILSHIERMLEDAERISPRPYQDLELAMQLVTGALNRAEEREVEEERLDLLRDYILDAEDLLKQAEAAAMAQQMPPMGMAPPEGAGEPMPPEAMGEEMAA